MKPIHPTHVWAIDFVHDKLRGGRSNEMLTLLDETNRQTLTVVSGTRVRVVQPRISYVIAMLIA
ncbi:hypothetical protein [uncultured Roseobacter sp.]|uniref:hypothetical protein n=1 Tax=uncultured Roseobacter sp. TaxID=114847 RepID=UPI0026244790|nr:hypothetical protein [uncultured Roseobacter sp.]